MVDDLDYNARQFLLKVLRQHDKIQDFGEIGRQSYRLTLTDGRQLVVFAANLYRMGLADLLEILAENPGTDIVVNISRWTEYSGDAKAYATSRKIGLFKLRDFMGALNWEKPWLYARKE